MQVDLWERIVEGAMITTGIALAAIGFALGRKFRTKFNKYVTNKKERQNKKRAA